MATPQRPYPPPKVDDYYRNIAQRLLDVHSAESVEPVEPTKLTIGDQSVVLPGTTFGAPRLSWDVYQSAQARALRDAYSVPVGRSYAPNGLPTDWDYRKEVVGPNGEPLPLGATSWDQYGRPYYGNKDYSLWGDVRSELMATFARFSQPSRETEFNAFSPEFWDRVKQTIGAELEAKETGTAGPDVRVPKLLLGETAKFFEQAFARAQNRPSGVEPVDTVLSGISKALTAGMRTILAAFQAPSIGWERGWGSALLANQMLAERSSLPDLPQMGGWAGKLQAISAPQIYWNSLRAAQAAISNPDIEAWKDIGVEAGQGSRIAYTLAYDRAKREEFIRRFHEGEDPRLLAVELEDPAMEAIGQTLNDPTILLGLVTRALRGGTAAAQAARSANNARWATAADNAFVDSIRTFDGSATHVDDVVGRAQSMYANARSGLTAEAAARGITAPIAGAKRFVHGQDVQTFLRVMQSHFGDDQDGFLNFLDGMVLATDPSDKGKVLEGLDLLSRSGAPLNTVFSGPGNETAVVLRNLLTDSDGAVNPAKTLLQDVADAGGDAAQLADLAGSRLDDAMGRMFPSVQEQFDQNRKFLSLLDEDPAAARSFLDSHPAADQPIARWMVSLADTHDTLQKWVYNPFRSLMSFAYMAISPGYWLKNRISNAIHIGADIGLGTGLKSLWRGKAGAEDELRRMFSYLPEAAGMGFGAAPEAPAKAQSVLGRLNRLSAAAADERGMRQIAMATVARREFQKVLRPGVVIPLLDDVPMGDYEKALLYQLTRDNWGDARKALQQFYKMRGVTGRNLGFLSRSQQEILADYGMLDRLKELLDSPSLEEALKGWDGLMQEFDSIADKAASESPMLDLSSLPPLEREAVGEAVDAIQKTAGDTAADLFTRQVSANEGAIDAAKAAANDMHRLAYREHFLRVGERLLAENNGKLPADVIWRQADEIARREVDGIMAAFDGPVAQTNEELMRRARAFTQLAWEVSEASKKKGANIRQLILDLGVPEGTEVDLSKGFRGWLWGNKTQPGYYSQAVHEMWIARREAVVAAVEEKARMAAQLAGVDMNTEAVRRAEESLRLARLFDDARIGRGGMAHVLDEAGRKVPLVTPDDGFTPSGARLAHESKRGLRQLHSEVRELLSKAWTGQPAPQIPPGVEDSLNAWADEGMKRVSTARLNIDDVATETANFSLHAYPKRVGADMVAGYIYPFHYWYSRTYAKWMRRMLQHPELIAAYARYRTYMEKKNAALPEWWRYNTRVDEFLGVDLKNPLYFNLEATLNPLYGMVGTDFNDRDRRVDWLSSTLDDLNKFGPTVWTPYQLALALAYHMQGKEEAAARWGGRLAGATGVLRDATAMMGVNQGKGLEIDPAILLFGGGLSPYERNRAGRELGGLMEEGVSERDAIDAAYNQEGPIWDMAVSRAINQRAAGNIASYFLGTGFKPRTDMDVEIDRMYAHRNAIMRMKNLMSPEEYRQQWDQLRQAYPYMEAVLLARKGGDERDESFAWNVLGRIPPGMTDDVAESMGLDYSVVQSFFDNKGLAGMPEGDRMKFMTAIAEMGAIMEAPSAGTRAEWNDAKSRNGRVYDRIAQMFGDDIWDRVDVYYGLKGEDNQDEANALLEQDPEIELALALKSMFVQQDPVLLENYGSISMLDTYWRGRMYDQIEREVGSDVWDQWTEYFNEPEGSARRAYWNSHPDLQRYVDIRDTWEPIVAQKIADFGGKIQETAPVFSGAPESSAQRQLMGTEFQRGLPQISASQWEDALGSATYRLVLDAARGESLPFRLQDKLEEVATEMGLPSNAWLVVELVAQSAATP